MSVGLGLAASVAFGFADFFGGFKSRAFGVLPVVFVSQATGLCVLAAVVVLSGSGRGDIRATLLAAAAGVFGTTALVAFYRGMVLGAISVVSAVSAVAPVIPVGVGLAAGEQLHARQWIGLVVALAGIAVVSLPTAADFDRRLAAGVPTALVAAIAIGLLLATLGLASEEAPLWASLVQRGVTVAIVAAAVLAWRPALPGVGQLGGIGAIGLADTTGSVCFTLASSIGLLAIAAVMASLYPLVTILLAHALVGERLNRRQWPAVAAVIAGVGLVTNA